MPETVIVASEGEKALVAALVPPGKVETTGLCVPFGWGVPGASARVCAQALPRQAAASRPRQPESIHFRSFLPKKKCIYFLLRKLKCLIGILAVPVVLTIFPVGKPDRSRRVDEQAGSGAAHRLFYYHTIY
jgi:hypothetical protein